MLYLRNASQAPYMKSIQFLAFCLREPCRVQAIQHSYYSLISNGAVRDKLGVKALSMTLLEQQLLYYGNIARKPPDDVVRSVVFEPGSLNLNRLPGKRRKGRPRNTWINKIHGTAIEIAGTARNLEVLVSCEHAWRNAVQNFCWI